MSWEDEDFIGGEDDDLDFGDEPGEDADAGDNEEGESKPSYKELQNVRLGPLGEGAGGPGGLSQRQQKSMRTAEEAATSKMWGVLSGGAYSHLGDTTKGKLVEHLTQKLGKRLIILNIETLMTAAVWRHEHPKAERPADAKAVQTFLKKMGTTVEAPDFIRYIRLLGAAEAPRKAKSPKKVKTPPKKTKKKKEDTELDEALAMAAEYKGRK